MFQRRRPRRPDRRRAVGRVAGRGVRGGHARRLGARRARGAARLARDGSRSTFRSPPGSAAGARTRRPRSGSATRSSRSRSTLGGCTRSQRRSVPTCRSSCATGRSSEPATARRSSRSTLPQDFAVCLLLPLGVEKRSTARGLRGVRPHRRRRGLRRARRGASRRRSPASAARRDLAALPPNDLATSPHSAAAARAGCVSGRRERRRSRRVRALRRPATRPLAPPQALSLEGRVPCGEPCVVAVDRR